MTWSGFFRAALKRVHTAAYGYAQSLSLVGLPASTATASGSKSRSGQSVYNQYAIGLIPWAGIEGSPPFSLNCEG